MLNPSLHSSARQDWQTPPEVLDLVRQIAPIGLDPCTTDKNPTGARLFYTPADNGLAQGWAEKLSDPWHEELTFVNPPYGPEVKHWIAKCVRESRPSHAQIVALVAARTDTAWWQDSIAAADAICFWRGRLRFVGAPTSAPFPSALVYWGRFRHKFEKAFASHGWVVGK